LDRASTGLSSSVGWLSGSYKSANGEQREAKAKRRQQVRENAWKREGRLGFDWVFHAIFLQWNVPA
jgi:hypothetical protein